MRSPNRVQAGVPTGGQFVEKSNAESGLDLAADPAQDAYASTLPDRIREEYRQIAGEREQLSLRIDAIDARMLADRILAQYPDAARLRMRRESGDSGYYYQPAELLDPDGNPITGNVDDHRSYAPDSITTLTGALDETRDSYVEWDDDGLGGEDPWFDVRDAAAIDLSAVGKPTYQRAADRFASARSDLSEAAIAKLSDDIRAEHPTAAAFVLTMTGSDFGPDFPCITSIQDADGDDLDADLEGYGAAHDIHPHDHVWEFGEARIDMTPAGTP